MTHTSKALFVLALTTFGIWGCAKGNSATADRTKATEARIARLEDDLKGAATARDEFKQKLDDIEARLIAAAERTRKTELERDKLQAALAAKAAEKDAALASFDELVTKLDAVLGQAKVAQANRTSRGMTATPVSNSQKSPAAAPGG